jgi:K+-sensing histidine kinase KdpD
MYILETEIIDSGIGISEDRQKMLFKPFLELRNKIGVVRAQNDNVGFGLSCSSSIFKVLGGDMKLKQS